MQEAGRAGAIVPVHEQLWSGSAQLVFELQALSGRICQA